MRKLILTLAVLVLTVQVAAAAQTGQPAPKPQGLITMDNPDDTLAIDKKRIEDRWSSLPGSPSKKSTKAHKPGKQPSPDKGNTP